MLVGDILDGTEWMVGAGTGMLLDITALPQAFEMTACSRRNKSFLISLILTNPCDNGPA